MEGNRDSMAAFRYAKAWGRMRSFGPHLSEIMASGGVMFGVGWIIHVPWGFLHGGSISFDPRARRAVYGPEMTTHDLRFPPR